MKKHIFYFLAALLAFGAFSSCQDPDYVDPTADRQGLTSLTAIFTSGPYVDQEAVKLNITDPDQTKFVIPIPWYFPVDSNSVTTPYMTAMRVTATMDYNCSISPGLGVLDLTKDNYFTFTDNKGNSRQIDITGERTKSSACQLLTFDLVEAGISGVIDQDSKTITLVSYSDIAPSSASVSISSHATISPDPAEVRDYNSDVQFTVTADNGTSKNVYTVKKGIPSKIPNGIRTDSQRKLFQYDISSLGVTDGSKVNPTLAVMGKYLVVDMGDGSAPIYLNKASGAKIGNIALGAADATGSVGADLAGNLLICNYCTSGKLNIYKTNSPTTAPTPYISLDNAWGIPLGSHIHVQGSLDGNAIITVNVDGPYAQHFLRWTVTGGGAPQMAGDEAGSPLVEISSAPGQWSTRPQDAKVVARSTNLADGYYYSYYDNNNVFYCGNNNKTISYLTPLSDNGNFNYEPIDTRAFNNCNYFVLYSVGWFPQWSTAGHLFFYDVSSAASFTGSVDGTGTQKLVYGFETPVNTTVAQGSGNGDVVMMPTQDGYMLDVYYIDGAGLVIGGVEFDCIQK
jgi:hypothetical protein